MKKYLLIVCAVILVIWFALSLSPDKKEVKVVEPHPGRDTIVCFGDSLTYGTGAAPALSYPAQLSRMLGKQVKNFGSPGATTAIALRKLPADVMRFMPAIVLVTLGANDLQNGVEKEAAMANLEKIITSINKAGGLAVVGGVKLPELDKGFAAGYKEVTEKTGAVLVEDVLGGVIGNSELMSDQIHPNGQGYKIIAEKFYAAVKPYM